MKFSYLLLCFELSILLYLYHLCLFWIEVYRKVLFWMTFWEAISYVWCQRTFSRNDFLDDFLGRDDFLDDFLGRDSDFCQKAFLLHTAGSDKLRNGRFINRLDYNTHGCNSKARILNSKCGLFLYSNQFYFNHAQELEQNL